jgi:hypothetical protein
MHSESSAMPQPAGRAGPRGTPGTLSALELRILAFERRWWKYAGAKEHAVGDTFGISATRYYQILNCLIDSPEALSHDPMLITRLRRVRRVRQGTQAGWSEVTGEHCEATRI